MAKVLPLANHLAYAPGRSDWLRSFTLLNSHRAFLGSFAEKVEDDGTCNPPDLRPYLQHAVAVVDPQHLAGSHDGILQAIAILLATPNREYEKDQLLSHIDAYLSSPAMAGTT